MTRLRMVAVLLMSSLAISACATDVKRVAELIPTPAERLVCEAAGPRPTIPPEYVIDWTKVTTVAQAQVEHQHFVAALRTREGIIAGHLLKLEGKLFVCFNNMEWRREFEANLKKSEP